MMPPGSMFEQDEAALSEYAAACKTAKEQLRVVWADLELGEDAVRVELDRIVSRAHEVWSEAVTVAKEKQREYGLQIEAAVRESRSIQEELGQSHRRASGIGGMGEEGSAMMTTHARLERAKRELDHWRTRKADRIQLLERLQADITRMQGLLGQTPDISVSGVLDINDEAREMLRTEIERLKEQQVERTNRLAEGVLSLQALCSIVGEEPTSRAEDVCPALATFRPDAVAEEIARIHNGTAALDLSDAMFAELQKKQAEMEAIKVDRERKVEEAEHLLADLWAELQVMESDVDRTILAEVLASDIRLQPAAMEKCQMELERLEVIKARKTCHTIRLKNDELLKVVSEAHMEDPGLTQMVQAVSDGPGEGEPMAFVRKVAETLARVQQMLDSVRAAALKRRCILDKIDEIGGSISEVGWLKEYEQDSNRFKGRDSTRNLQRSIKAERVRAQLPALLEGTIQALVDWEDREGEDFLYDGVCYKDHLVQLKEETEQSLMSKSTRGHGASGSRAVGGAPVAAAGRRLPAGRPSTAGARPASGHGKNNARMDAPASLQRSTGRPAASPAASPWSTPKKAAPKALPANAKAAEPLAPKSHTRQAAAVESTPSPAPAKRHARSPLSVNTSAFKELSEVDVNSPRATTPQSGGSKHKAKFDTASNDLENCEPPQKHGASPLQQPPGEQQPSKPSRLPAPKSMLRPPSSKRQLQL